jgi:hypothetical protein
MVLIGCGKSKASEATAASELYTGCLFRARRRYAEAQGCPWFVISAKYGLLQPNQQVAPYDLRLDELSQVDQAAWALGVAQQLLEHVGDNATLRNIHIEIHASEVYADRLRDVLIAAGFCCSWPTKGLSQGELMAHYSQQGA